MIIFCKKHKLRVLVYGCSLENKWKSLNSKCNCVFNNKQVNKLRVLCKIRYFLKDGSEIIKINNQLKYKLIKQCKDVFEYNVFGNSQTKIGDFSGN